MHTVRGDAPWVRPNGFGMRAIVVSRSSALLCVFFQRSRAKHANWRRAHRVRPRRVEFEFEADARIRSAAADCGARA
eukprot:12404583-Alexandrium_andersonii.AAC.1